MRLTDYERNARREIERWQTGEGSYLQQALNLVMRPVDWAVSEWVPERILDPLSDAIAEGLGRLHDASAWTTETKDLLKAAREEGLDVDDVEALRDEPLEKLDALAKRHFSQNALLAALEGGGTSLGGPLFIAADIPLLFTIGFRTIRQVGASYGFPLDGPAYRPLVIAIFSAAASGSREAKDEALRELSVAAAAFAFEGGYRGRPTSGTLREQSRNVPRELAKALAARKLGQLVPLAGAVVGAGVNYVFTEEVARTAHMLFRALYLERKERL